MTSHSSRCNSYFCVFHVLFLSLQLNGNYSYSDTPLKPFRTEKLSLYTLMVLHDCGRVRRCQRFLFDTNFKLFNNMKIKKVFQKGSSWIKKTPSKLQICILTTLMYIVLMIGDYHNFQQCHSQQQAELILSDIVGIEITLREYNLGKTEEYKKKMKR